MRKLILILLALNISVNLQADSELAQQEQSPGLQSGSQKNSAIFVKDLCDLEILTPSLANRKTRKIRLNNGLEAILISDPDTHQSGAALSVGVGSWDDPRENPGMAHFVEHMLFLGTEKYPREEEYAQFLNENGGTHNAYTLDDRTVYMFSIDTHAFFSALDRFGHFFISPLFNDSGLERERKAVHQEYCKNIPLDHWRFLFVKKELANPDHPFHDFCIGNADTLKSITNKQAKAWYAAHYSANLMHLVLYSPFSLDEMQNQVVDLFSQVSNLNLTPAVIEQSLTLPNYTNQLIVVKPIQDTQMLTLTWELPRFFGQDQELHADQLVSYVLGHEGTNSLLAQLKHEGYAEKLGAGAYRAGKDQSFFYIDVQLTSKGVESYPTVIQRCYESIASLKTSGIPRYIYDEYVDMKKIRYAYQARREIFEFVSEYASEMVDEAFETFPKKHVIPSRFDKNRIAEFLNCLRPETCQYMLAAPVEKSHLQPDHKEKWLGAEYTIIPLADDLIQRLNTAIPHPEISIPAPNRFMPTKKFQNPTRFQDEKPLLPKVELLRDSSHGKFFFSQDDRFFTPEICWIFRFRTPSIRDANINSHVLADLYCHAVQEALNPLAYEAKMASLSYTLKPTHDGLLLQVKGFGEKASVFIQKIAHAMAHFKPTPEIFSSSQESVARIYRNANEAMPIKQSKEVLWSLIYKDYPGEREKEPLLSTMRSSDFAAFCHSIWKENYIEGLLFGNLDANEANKVWDILEKEFHGKSFERSSHPKIQIADFSGLTQPVLLELETKQPSNSLILMTDWGPFDYKNRAVQQILMKGLKEPFFSELRTRQQTAYLLTNWGEEIEKHLFTFFAIQSSSHESRDLLARFELFFETTLRDLSTTLITKDRFESIRKACIHKLKHPATTPSTMGEYLFTLAFNYDADFDWPAKGIQALNELSYEEFLKISETFMGNVNQKRVAVAMNGTFSEKKGYRLIMQPVLRKEISYKGH